MSSRASRILENQELKRIIKEIVLRRLDGKPINSQETLRSIIRIFRRYGVKRMKVAMIPEAFNILVYLSFDDGSIETLALDDDSEYVRQLVEFIYDVLLSMDPSRGAEVFRTRIEGVDVAVYPP
jgi:hypothetical protein